MNWKPVRATTPRHRPVSRGRQRAPGCVGIGGATDSDPLYNIKKFDGESCRMTTVAAGFNRFEFSSRSARASLKRGRERWVR